MQSGRANTRRWVMEFEPSAARVIDRLMGWSGSADTAQQVRMTFTSRDDAVAFAKRNRFDYQISEPNEQKMRRKSYAGNFRYQRPR
jgi:hypothetical protein